MTTPTPPIPASANPVAWHHVPSTRGTWEIYATCFGLRTGAGFEAVIDDQGSLVDAVPFARRWPGGGFYWQDQD